MCMSRLPNGYWTKEKCKEEALKFSLRSDFKNMSAVAYRKCIDNRWLEELTTHMFPKRYSLKDAQDIAHSHNGNCLTQKFTGIKQRMKWECQNKHIWYATLDQLVHLNTWCDTCFREFKNEERKKVLIEKLNSFNDKYNRPPKRREFNEWCNGVGSSSSCVTHWGSFSNFLESNGFISGKGIFGQSWRVWEALVGDILKHLYPKLDIYAQYFDKKSNTIIDYYIPSLGIAVDAKTSNYYIKERATQWKKYLSAYKEVHFYCLRKDISQVEQINIKYMYAETMIKKITSKTILKKIKFLLEKGDEYKSQMGLINKESILSQIKILAGELERTPKMREFSRDPRFTNHATISLIFGSWNSAIKEAGLDARKQYAVNLKPVDAYKEFERAYNDFCVLFEREPKFKEFNDFISIEKYLSWKQIRKLTGKTFLEILKG